MLILRAHKEQKVGKMVKMENLSSHGLHHNTIDFFPLLKPITMDSNLNLFKKTIDTWVAETWERNIYPVFN